MRNLLFAQLALLFAGSLATPVLAGGSYWLVIGSYRQGPGGRPEVSGITSPSVFAIPMETIELCQIAGKKISDKIYKPVWNFDNRWTCVKANN